MFIAFVHGLRQKGDEWGLLSSTIAQALDADFDDFQYSARIFTRSSPEMAARSLQSSLALKADENEIFVVGYSLGGLIARLMVERLLRNDTSKPELLPKIGGIVTIGTPLHGPRSRLHRSPFAKLSRWTRFIANQATSSRIEYRGAITAAKRAGRPHPKFSHIEFEEDQWAAKHDLSLYTEDDIAGAVIRGKHTEITQGDRSRQIQSQTIDELRRLRSSKVAKVVPPVPAQSSVSSIILISCSATKSSANEITYEPPKPGAWLSDRSITDTLLSKRSSILAGIKNSLIEDRTYGQGNRGDKIDNHKIIQGPDFGFPSEEANRYLRAFDRYTGRLFGPLRGIDWSEFHSRQNRPLILIMSGLYGFVQSDEMIQNYDVHLSDIEHSTNTPLRGLWTDWFTNSLNSLVGQIGSKTRIYDLLADEDYTGAISWSSLDRDKCSVYHLMGYDPSDQTVKMGKDLLVPAGAILSGIIRQPGLDHNLQRSTSEESAVVPLARFSTDLGANSGLLVTFERSIGELEGKINWSDA